MGDKFNFSKNKGKTNVNGSCAKQFRDCGTLGFRMATVSLPKPAKPCLAKSRIIPNQYRKSKKAKGKRAYGLIARMQPSPFPLCLRLIPDGKTKNA